MTRNNSKREHKQILKEMQDVDPEESMILVATGSLIGEGFDYQRLDTLIMATPVSFRGVVEQYAGRLNRDYKGKENVIVYDYVDSHIPMFDNMFSKRLTVYSGLFTGGHKKPKLIRKIVCESFKAHNVEDTLAEQQVYAAIETQSYLLSTFLIRKK